MPVLTKKYIAFGVLLIAGLLIASDSFAHTVNYALEKAPAGSVISYYLKLGIAHILPNGLDHILFVASLCLLNTRVKTILWQATAFTLAHSITLALSMKGVITLPAEIVEPVIALSILFVALENLLLKELRAGRIIVVFLFGLIHGMGFARSLNEIGLPRNQFLTSILSFNLGVELAQIAIILLVYFLLVRPFGNHPGYRKRLVYPVSLVIALTAAWWTIERMG
jgi:hypothetical protein